MQPEIGPIKTLNEILEMCFADRSFYTEMCVSVQNALTLHGVSVTAADFDTLKDFSENALPSPPGVLPNVRSVMAFMFDYTQLKNDGRVVPAWGKTDPPIEPETKQ